MSAPVTGTVAGRSWPLAVTVWLVRVVWAGLRWGVRHWRWSVVSAVLAAGVIGWQRPAVLALLVGVVPAVVCGMWSTGSPRSWEVVVAGPLYRFGWWCWARTQWKAVARAIGASVETSTRRNTLEWSRALGGGSRTGGGRGLVSTSAVVRTWRDPRLARVLIRRDTMTLRVGVRLGLSVEELMSARPRVRDAAGAYAVRCLLGPHPGTRGRDQDERQDDVQGDGGRWSRSSAGHCLPRWCWVVERTAGMWCSTRPMRGVWRCRVLPGRGSPPCPT